MRRCVGSAHRVQAVELVRSSADGLHLGGGEENATVEEVAHATGGHLHVSPAGRSYNTFEAEKLSLADFDHALAEDVVELLIRGEEGEADFLVVLDPEVNLLVVHGGVEDVIDLVWRGKRDKHEGICGVGGRHGRRRCRPP